MTSPLPVAFVAGKSGLWRIETVKPVIGDSLPAATRLTVIEDVDRQAHDDCAWILRGVTSNIRYTNRREADALASQQQGLNRSEAVRAALIPIRKNAAWWALTQDERRAVFEEQSQHIGIGMTVLPEVSRRLHHARDLGGPFDFLTWFEYAPAQADAFETMVAQLRATPEWRYVDWEIDIRLSRA
ncbi:chlorite dismutase [Methylobacterium sp. C25]|uniref:chlorite dismutase family protein n=1 Tax=Methylobacterium sp. C25 TaxID=2721622 RepID=UPI001F2D1C49|nr:chlorite dismutase family protein [Methylobacterium sp. C25]MCE4222381.1 chlorite dismutase [Methylobacterium sp. C25]